MTPWERNLAEWKAVSEAIQERTDRIQRRIDDVARNLGEASGMGRDYAYHLSHNWLLCPEVPPEKARVYRRILLLQRRGFLAGRIGKAMATKEWERIFKKQHKATC